MKNVKLVFYTKQRVKWLYLLFFITLLNILLSFVNVNYISNLSFIGNYLFNVYKIIYHLIYWINILVLIYGVIKIALFRELLYFKFRIKRLIKMNNLEVAINKNSEMINNIPIIRFRIWTDNKKLFVSYKYNSKKQINDFVEEQIETVLTRILERELLDKREKNKEFIFKFSESPKYLNEKKENFINNLTFYQNKYKTKIPLSYGMYWDYKAEQGALICGKSGSGKTQTLKKMFLNYFELHKREYYIIDFKNDKEQFKEYQPKKYITSIGGTIGIMRDIVENWEERNLNSSPIFIVFDEYLAISQTVKKLGSTKKEKQDKANFNKYWEQIVLMGRSKSVIPIILTQNANADNIDRFIRDQFSLKVGVGNLEKEELNILFNDRDTTPQEKEFIDKNKIVFHSLVKDNSMIIPKKIETHLEI